VVYDHLIIQPFYLICLVYLLLSLRVLVKCVTVPKLIQHADELEQMLEIATDLDLAGKYSFLLSFCLCLV